VRVIADGPLGAGEHRLGWDGTDASGARARAGVYYCRLLTGGERRSTTIVLTR
jgi:flagellar hook assembly protein FlgD